MAEVTYTRERARRFLIRGLSRIHARAYRISRGRVLGRIAGMPVLLLTTTGRESGKPRTATLTYFRDAADLVVVGSFGGLDLPPAWWLNLQRDPRAAVLIGGTTLKVTARTVTAEEHDRLWPLITKTHSGYARYQERTARPIPIVLLAPEGGLSRCGRARPQAASRPLLRLRDVITTSEKNPDDDDCPNCGARVESGISGSGEQLREATERRCPSCGKVLLRNVGGKWTIAEEAS